MNKSVAGIVCCMTASLISACILAGCQTNTSVDTTVDPSQIASNDTQESPLMLFRLGDLYSLSANELVEYLNSFNYRYLNQNDLFVASATNQLSAYETVQVLNYGNKWFPDDYVSIVEGEWSTNSLSDERDAAAYDKFNSPLIDGYLIGVSIYDNDYLADSLIIAQGTQSAYDNPLWEVEHRLNGDDLIKEGNFSALGVFLQPESAILGQTVDTATISADSIMSAMANVQSKTGLPRPTHQSVWMWPAENECSSGFPWYMACSLGFCEVNGVDCWYSIRWSVTSNPGDERGEMFIGRLDDALAVNGASSQGELIEKWLERNTSHYVRVL